MKCLVHDFAERLSQSLALSDEPSWIEFYLRIWPKMISCVRVDADSPLQRAGVDRLILLPHRQVPLYVDEKKRDKDWGDFLLEEYSVLETRKIGWTLDEHKICDFVAYAVPGRCWLLPFEPLRIACTAHLAEWKQRRGAYPKDAKNSRYTTRNVSVPWDELWRAIRRVCSRRWGSTLQLPTHTTIDGQLMFPWDESPEGR
jgi:hypothetical protein